MDNRCKLWLQKKNRFCANIPLNNSPFCGNHTQRSDDQWIPCPIDPSHSVLQENLESHLKRCPLMKQTRSLSLQPFYQKGINAGNEKEEMDVLSNKPESCHKGNVTSEMKRNAVYSMTLPQFYGLLKKIRSIHATVYKDVNDSYKLPEACSMWIKREVDRKIPFQEKHVVQQASILGNLEEFGVLKSCTDEKSNEIDMLCGDHNVPAVVEFGAGRGYLTQMLADCYGIKRVYLVERKSYKLKADRSLRQKESLVLERLRIDIEDLNLNGVKSLHGVPYVAVGKHLCGPATDLTLRCCLAKTSNCHDEVPVLKGLAIATCCHHLCQWEHYINKNYFSKLGISKDEFHAITWFTSWAVDADHGSDLFGAVDYESHKQSVGKEEHGLEGGQSSASVEETVRNMEQIERAVLGFMCKQIVDVGRLMWIKECGLDTELVKYVSPTISPENHLLIAKHCETRTL